MDAIFTGTVRECIAHYVRKHSPGKWKKNSGAAFWAIVKFIGVRHSTVSGWFYRKSGLDGYREICMAFFLEAFGYSVVELTRLRQFYPHSYLLTELLGYGLITPLELTRKLGFCRKSEMFALARGRNILRTHRIEIIQRLHKERSSELEDAKCRLSVLAADFRRKSVNLPLHFKPRDESPPVPIRKLADEVAATLRFIEASRLKCGAEFCDLDPNDLRRLSDAASRLCAVMKDERRFDRRVARRA